MVRMVLWAIIHPLAQRLILLPMVALVVVLLIQVVGVAVAARVKSVQLLLLVAGTVAGQRVALVVLPEQVLIPVHQITAAAVEVPAVPTGQAALGVRQAQQ